MNMQAAFDKHNELRALHGAPPLQWSKSCRADAELAANHCQSKGYCQHSNHDEQDQNLYGPSRSSGMALAGTQNWYDEKKDFDFANGQFGMDTGHFTQLVWKSTTHVGIARSSNGQFLAANYFPSGNVEGDFRNNVGQH